MKATIETLEFPCEFKKKLKMEASLGNLNINFINGHLIKINNTNLSVSESYRIIIKNNSNTLIAYFIIRYTYMIGIIRFYLDNLYFNKLRNMI